MPRTPDPLADAVKAAEKRLSRAETAYSKADAAFHDADDELTDAQNAAVAAQVQYHEAQLAQIRSKQPQSQKLVVQNVTTGPAS